MRLTKPERYGELQSRRKPGLVRGRERLVETLQVDAARPGRGASLDVEEVVAEPVHLITRYKIELRTDQAFGGPQLQFEALDVPFRPAKLFAPREGLGQGDVPVGNELSDARII